MLKNLDGSERQAKWRKAEKTPPARNANGTLLAATFISGACSVSAITHERLKKVIVGPPPGTSKLLRIVRKELMGNR